MTSTTDEITNLRAALDDILTWCHNTATHTPSDVERTTCNHIAAMARRALKTPRASKMVQIDTLRLDWVLEHCDIAFRVPRDTVSKRQLYVGISTREAIDTVREIG